jgi:hypothetical protein
MNLRRRFAVVAGVWTALVAGLLAVLPRPWQHRLPNPIASHWGPSGTPDASASFRAITALPLVLWALAAGCGLLIVVRSKGITRRESRAWTGAIFAGAGVFLLGLEGLTIWANLDRTDWHDAANSWPAVLLVLASAAVAAAGGWLLARQGPDERPGHRTPVLSHPLRPGERAVWVSSLSVRWLMGLAAACLVVAAAVSVLTVINLPWPIWTVAPLSVVAIAVLTVSTIRVQVDDRGLAIAFGPLRWPTRTVALRKIERAWVEERQPHDVGGWGYRGLPGAATIMLRGGECLVVRYTSGGELGISIDDAEHGAALLNALVAKGADRADRAKRAKRTGQG